MAKNPLDGYQRVIPYLAYEGCPEEPRFLSQEGHHRIVVTPVGSDETSGTEAL